MQWLAATIAYKNQHLNKNLGSSIKDENMEIPTGEFEKFVKDGSLIYPSSEFHNDVVKMHAVFSSIHPHKSLSKGPGVVQKCLFVLSQHFPKYHPEILHFTARLFTFSRLRLMNELANQSNTKSRGPETARGRVFLARRSKSN